MKQTSRIISTYSADTFGVCSALFELGGMTVMHDASGCNSTYTTHDEPRWYDMDSMVFISALSEMEALMGDDEKLIGDIAAAAKELGPKFIALCGTPIPAMTGFDYEAAARVIERETGIPTMGFATTGMNTYVQGASMALEELARRFVREDVTKTEEPSVNILGLTPLDYSVNGTDGSIVEFCEKQGFSVLSRWAMGSSLEEISRAGGAHVNLVVSASGLAAAKVLQSRFGIPYVAGVPYGGVFAGVLAKALRAGTGPVLPELPGEDIVIIGEGVTSVSLARAIELQTGRGTRVLCPTECDPALLRKKDRFCRFEEKLEAELQTAKTVIADPMFRPICPAGVHFVELPAESCSGRIYRDRIPDLVKDFPEFLRKLSVGTGHDPSLRDTILIDL